MQVAAVSGKTVAQLDEDELHCMVESCKTVRDLKRLLSVQVGCSRFQQRLVSDEIGELQDYMPLRPLPSVQLIVLPFCVLDEITEEELVHYCREDRVTHVERLLQKPYKPKGKALLVAAREGHLEIVRLLLEAGADKDAATTTDGATALLLAAFQGHLEVVRLLLEAGADKDSATTDGATALLVADREGHLEIVRLLLEAGADKDAATTDGATALLLAAFQGHLEVVRLLLEAGADKDSAMTDGATPLYSWLQNRQRRDSAIGRELNLQYSEHIGSLLKGLVKRVSRGGGGRFSGGHVHSCYCPCCCPSSALSILP